MNSIGVGCTISLHEPSPIYRDSEGGQAVKSRSEDSDPSGRENIG